MARVKRTTQPEKKPQKEIEKKPKHMSADPEKDHMEQMKGQPSTGQHMAGNPHTDAATVRAGPANFGGGGLGAPGDQDTAIATAEREQELLSRPRFDDDGNPIDPHGRARALDPGEAGEDGVEREMYTVGKGGATVRGKLFLEGEGVMLSEEEANQILDMGNLVTHVDPVEAEAIAKRRAEREEKRRDKRAKAHEEARKEAQDF